MQTKTFSERDRETENKKKNRNVTSAVLVLRANKMIKEVHVWLILVMAEWR